VILREHAPTVQLFTSNLLLAYDDPSKDWQLHL